MAIGTIEVILGLAVLLGTAVAVVATKNRFLFGVPGLFAVAVIFSHADPLSSLLIAVPSSLVYTFAVTSLQRRTAGWPARS